LLCSTVAAATCSYTSLPVHLPLSRLLLIVVILPLCFFEPFRGGDGAEYRPLKVLTRHFSIVHHYFDKAHSWKMTGSMQNDPLLAPLRFLGLLLLLLRVSKLHRASRRSSRGMHSSRSKERRSRSMSRGRSSHGMRAT